MGCLVVGGTGALGQTVCRHLAAEGARFAFTFHRNKALAASLAGESGSTAFPLDLAGDDDLERVVDRAAEALDGLDGLVFCSGLGVALEPEGPGSRHRMATTDAAAFDALMAVNVRGPFLVCRRAVEFLQRRGGNVVLVSSVDAAKPMPSPVHFAASQTALRGLTQSMAKEVGEKRIRVNLVAAGLMEEGISKTVGEDSLAEYRKHCSLGRPARTNEVAAAVVWLALHNTYVTGQVIVVDGGL